MTDSKQREADLIQARERLATALTRLSTLVGGIPEQFQLLDRSRTDAIQRLKEIENLLENERTIAAQRDSLSDTTREQLQATTEELSAARETITARDARIASFETEVLTLQEHSKAKDTELLGLHAELEAKQATIDTLDEQNRQLEERLLHLQEQVQQLHHDRDALQQQFEQRQPDQEVAMQFSKDERQQLLQTVDTLIERIDRIIPINGQH